MTEESQVRTPLWHQSRFRILVGILLLLLMLLAAPLAAPFAIGQLVDWLPDTPNDKLNRIEPGMNANQVLEILGPPAGGPLADGPLGKIPPVGRVLWGFPGEGVAFVSFDSEGKATHKGWCEHTSERSLKDRLRDWLGL